MASSKMPLCRAHKWAITPVHLWDSEEYRDCKSCLIKYGAELFDLKNKEIERLGKLLSRKKGKCKEVLAPITPDHPVYVGCEPESRKRGKPSNPYNNKVAEEMLRLKREGVTDLYKAYTTACENLKIKRADRPNFNTVRKNPILRNKAKTY